MEIYVVTFTGEEEDRTVGAFSDLDKAKAACPGLLYGWDQYGECWRGDTEDGHYFIVHGLVDEVLPAY